MKPNCDSVDHGRQAQTAPRLFVYAFAAVRYDTDMPQRPFLAFTCAHLTDERLYAAQVAALEGDYECTVFAFRDHDSLGAMAEELLASTPAHFTLIGLSLGGYLAFEIVRRQLQRLQRLVFVYRNHDGGFATETDDVVTVVT